MIQGLAISRSEGEVVFAVPLRCLATLAELRNEGWVERYLPPPVPRLGWAVAAPHERPPYLHVRTRPVEREIAPAKRDQLRPSESRRGKQPEHRPVAEVDKLEQPCKLLPRKGANLFAVFVTRGRRTVRQRGPGGRVVADEPLVNGAGEARTDRA